MLLARHCPVCRQPARSICGPCLAALPRWRPAGPWAGARVADLGLDGFSALFAYEPPVARVVLAAKNGGRHDLLTLFGRWLAPLALTLEPTPILCVHGLTGETVDARSRPDVVTWVPASRLQARRRGYDQGRELAVAVARPLGTRALPLLARAGREAQAHRTRADRLAGPTLRGRARCPPRVLLVDDVATTGASLARAAHVLRASRRPHGPRPRGRRRPLMRHRGVVVPRPRRVGVL